jgi:hypothetical protein
MIGCVRNATINIFYEVGSEYRKNIMNSIYLMPHRIFALFFILFSARFASYSQVGRNSLAVYNSVPGITILTNDSLQGKIGIFKMGESLGGELLDLDSTMHFQKRVYADVCGCGILDSGAWIWHKPGMIGLKSKSGLQLFDLIKYRHFYLCIPTNKRGKFVADLLSSQKQFKNIKPIHVDDVIYTADDIAVYSLMKKYHLRDLNE